MLADHSTVPAHWDAMADEMLASTALSQPTGTPWWTAASAPGKNTDSQLQHRHVRKIMSISVPWIPHPQNGCIHRNGDCQASNLGEKAKVSI